MEEQQLNGSNSVKKKYNKKAAVIEDKAQPPQEDRFETPPKGQNCMNKHKQLNVTVRAGDILLEFDDITLRVGRSSSEACNS